MSPDPFTEDVALSCSGSALAVAVAVVIVLVRPLEQPIAPLLALLGVMLFVLNAPLFIARRTSTTPWWLRPAPLTFAMLATIALCGTLLDERAHVVGIGFACLGVVAFVAQLPALRWRSFALLTVPAALYAVFGIGIAWGVGYRHPRGLSLLANGIGHRDTLYHMSIANMLRTYATPTTGLDGTPFVHYHYGSHWLMAQLADMSGLSVFALYNVAYPLIALPLLWHCIGTLGRELRRDGSLHMWPLVIAMGGFLPTALLNQIGLYSHAIITSESFCIGISTAALVIGSAVAFGRAHSHGLLDELIAACFFPLALTWLAVCKISVGAIVFALVLYGFARLKLWRRPLLLVALAWSAASLLFVFRVTSAVAPGTGYSGAGIMLGAYFRQIVPPAWWPLFPWLYFLWAIVFFSIRSSELSMPNLRAGRLWDVELLVVCVLVSAAPGFVLAIIDGNHYFMDVQNWVAVALLTTAPILPADTPRLRKLLVLGVATSFVGIAVVNAYERITVARQFVMVRPKNAAQLRALESLKRIDALPRAEKRTSLLSIPRSDPYWQLGTEKIHSFIAPALTGVALLDGAQLPQHTDDDYEARGFYGWAAYHGHESLPHDPCERARALGFQQILVFATDAELTRVSCAR